MQDMMQDMMQDKATCQRKETSLTSLEPLALSPTAFSVAPFQLFWKLPRLRLHVWLARRNQHSHAQTEGDSPLPGISHRDTRDQSHGEQLHGYVHPYILPPTAGHDMNHRPPVACIFWPTIGLQYLIKEEHWRKSCPSDTLWPVSGPAWPSAYFDRSGLEPMSQRSCVSSSMICSVNISVSLRLLSLSM